jgi:DNA sulfur modification protein DndB
METSFEYSFPAIRGIQAKREYYVSMCPLRLIPRLFSFDDEDLRPELRAQRNLNKSRIPEISRYIVENNESYVFSAISASVDSEIRFEPVGTSSDNSRVGVLHIPMTAKFIINDGQHRSAAIENALRERPELADETIAVVFFLDKGLERCQQMFADLNRHAIRPSRSLNVLYDHRDDRAQLTKLIVFNSPIFNEVVEMEKSTLSPRSRKLFTLSAIYTATAALLANNGQGPIEAQAKIASKFWNEVAKQFPEWKHVKNSKITAGDVRRDFIHSHGIALHALGNVGNILLRDHAKNWKTYVKKLKAINWSRSNAKLWEGRAMIGGRASKSINNVILTTNAIKKRLDLPLTPEEQRLEDAYQRGDNGK